MAMRAREQNGGCGSGSGDYSDVASAAAAAPLASLSLIELALRTASDGALRPTTSRPTAAEVGRSRSRSRSVDADECAV